MSTVTVSLYVMPSSFLNKCHSFSATYCFQTNGTITNVRECQNVQKMEKEGEPASMRMFRRILRPAKVQTSISLSGEHRSRTGRLLRHKQPGSYSTSLRNEKVIQVFGQYFNCLRTK